MGRICCQVTGEHRMNGAKQLTFERYIHPMNSLGHRSNSKGGGCEICSGMPRALEVKKMEEDERLEVCPDSRGPFPPIERNRLSIIKFTSIKLAAWVVADLI